MPSRRPPSLTALPSYLAGQVARMGRVLLTEALDRHGLRPPHFAMLAALSDFGPLPQSELGSRLGFNPSHVVGYLDALQQRGLVRRDRHDSDRRRLVVALTVEGAAFHRDLAAVARESDERFLHVLDDNERATLTALLRRVVDAEWPT